MTERSFPDPMRSTNAAAREAARDLSPEEARILAALRAPASAVDLCDALRPRDWPAFWLAYYEGYVALDPELPEIGLSPWGLRVLLELMKMRECEKAKNPRLPPAA